MIDKITYIANINKYLQANGTNIEKQRRKFITDILKSMIASFFIWALIFIAVVEWDVISGKSPFNFSDLLSVIIYSVLLSLVINIVTFIINVQNDSKDFSYKLKSRIYDNIFPMFGKINYDKQKPIIKNNIINDALIFPKYDSRLDDDNFSITQAGTTIKIDEIALTKKESDGKYHQKYRGVVICYEMKKFADAQIIILPKHVMIKLPKNFQSVKLEDVSFMKKYNVYSTDQVEARYILTTAFIDRFLKLKINFQADTIKCSISDNTLVISMENKFRLDLDLFELGSVYTSYTNIKKYERIYDEITSLLSVYETLNLKTNL